MDPQSRSSLLQCFLGVLLSLIECVASKKWKIIEFLQLSAKTASKLCNLMKSYRILKTMAAKKVKTKTYCNIDEILDFVLDEADPESDIEVDLGSGISDDELESDWGYESEPNATKQSKTIPTNIVMTGQSSASSVNPEYDNNNDTYFEEVYVDSIDNNSITSSSSHSDSGFTADERFSPQPKREKTWRTHDGRPRLGGHLQVQGGIFGTDRGKPGNDHGCGSGQIGHHGGQVAQCGARDGCQACCAGHGACAVVVVVALVIMVRYLFL